MLNYKDVLSLTELPGSIAVVDARAVGIEVAHFYAGLGVEVSLIEYKSRILCTEDEDMSSALSHFLFSVVSKYAPAHRLSR